MSGYSKISIYKTPIEVNSIGQGLILSAQKVSVELTDGVNPVVPTSSTLVGNELTIVTPKDLELLIPYLTDDTTVSITVVAGSDGIITTADTTGLTGVTFEKNSIITTLPITLAVGDILTINFDLAIADGVIKLNGTYA